MIQLYDTTLRDGAQSAGINFTLEDKLLIVKELDKLGISYIEGGWPHKRNIKEIEFFKRVQKLNFKSKIVAFGSTKKPDIKAKSDQFLNDILASEAKIVAIFGKSWDLHVEAVLRTTLEENLKMIKNSVAYLKENVQEVIYDAEHFFDGYKVNKRYAIQTILAAQDGGADFAVFCDTNGGCLPEEIKNIIREIKPQLKIPFGIHCHNDAGLAVANTLAAIQNGATQIQGTINGYGERCGNADLCALIPNLKLKMNIDCVTDKQLIKLKNISNMVGELANRKPFDNQPYVGNNAFTHKGGMHIDAVLKNKRTFEHIKPELVGNTTDWLVSEQAGRGLIAAKLNEMGFNFEKGSSEVENILIKVKEREAVGYTYEVASASFKLLILEILNKFKRPFIIDHYEVNTKQSLGEHAESTARVCVSVDQSIECNEAFGNGPVNALDLALRRALSRFYPTIDEVELIDYKVRVLSGKDGTAARVRVLIIFSDVRNRWSTVGVSTNIIEASWEALLEGLYYKLLER